MTFKLYTWKAINVDIAFKSIIKIVRIFKTDMEKPLIWFRFIFPLLLPSRVKL